jgi:hypothetical protein
MLPQPLSGPSEEFVALGHMESKRRRRRIWFVILSILVYVALILIWMWFWPSTFPSWQSAKRSTEPQVLYAWVQMLPDTEGGITRGLLARAIFAEGERCPRVKEGERTIPMRRVSPPVRSAFPVLLCEAELDGDSAARIGDRTLPVRPAEPNDIVVIGDTGCRITYYSQKQSCTDGESWPFRKNAAHAAESITPQSFVFHLGDLHYREHPCADSNSFCGGSPYGDNWETWEADFFAPADRLLRAAPWIIMRGNHENCDRAGAGWLFFFALPGKQTENNACQDDIAPSTFTIGKTADNGRSRLLVVMDTSNDESAYGKAGRDKAYLNSLEKLDRAAASEVWLAVHQPLWLRAMNGFQDIPKRPDGTYCEGLEEYNKLPGIRKKFEDVPDKRLARLVLSGDTHAFQFFRPKQPSMPIQIVAGNGGTQLDKLYKAAVRGAGCPKLKDSGEAVIEAGLQDVPEPDEAVKSFGVEGTALTVAQFGYTVLHREGHIWSVRQFDADGRQSSSCDFSEAANSSASNRPLVCVMTPKN